MVTKTTTPVELLRELSARLAKDSDFERIAATISAGNNALLDGVHASSCALGIAALTRSADFDTFLVVIPEPKLLDSMSSDLDVFTDQRIDIFPALDATSGRSTLMDEAYGERLRVLKELARGTWPRILVTSIQALQQPVPSVQEVADQTRMFRTGKTLDVDELSEWLVRHDYHHTTAVELPGEFSVRGGIVDIFATDWVDPVRIEMFGDEIESMRRFDRGSQRSLMPMDEIEVTVLTRQRPRESHLVEYLSEKTCVVFQQPDEIQSEGQRYLERISETDRHHGAPAVFKSLAQLPSVSTWGLAGGTEDTTVRMPIETVERFSGDVNQIRDLLETIGQGHQTFVVCQTDAESERLTEIFSSTKLAAQGKLHCAVGRLRSGFRLPSEKTLVLSGAEMFGRADVKRTSRKRSGKAIDSFMDLRDGDLVVHLGHGIGRYRGLKLLEKENQKEEHLEIEFHGGTKIYVPASRIELVQKYVGGRKALPRLAKIGGKQWAKHREAAATAAKDLAAEMLDLHAEREAAGGIVFGADTDWQREFDAAFPFHETPDQLTAIDAIKQDLGKNNAMDRLLCGDVGFGKTEMAMRAAFKAVDNGFQVAVLVPTTILAEQHYRSFCQRMAEFPFRIAKLSRFCSPKEQRETIKALSCGGVDIVIGTHRVASKDVVFENLGLVIIDEEQRFGVAVKDRLKQLRSAVNVLTLSATPIPRTLHMALTGIRGISNLETPPEERLAVETRVLRWDDKVIRSAIMRELSRNGQVYFVHNRVHDIEKVRNKIQDLVPDASIVIGHGQMPEGELEQVMVQFIAGEHDILLATTIIESGLDIPNANTIFIDDANMYGLADLHQLRGRVGRDRRRAYCYLLIDPAKSLTPDAARRLRAIEEFSEMGAGFAISMRDLEIRGAGNILGTQQSGHIATVGYELYCQLLEAAVRRLRNLPPKLEIDVTMELPGEAHLPRGYVPDMRAKIDIYRRLARTFDEEGLQAIREELEDRFGKIPEAVERLFELTRLKADMALWQINSIHIDEDRYLAFGYQDRQRADQLVRQSNKKIRMVDDGAVYSTIPKGMKDPDEIISFTRGLLAVK